MNTYSNFTRTSGTNYNIATDFNQVNKSLAAIIATTGTAAPPRNLATVAAAQAAKVTGPASATADALVLFDSTTGKLVKDSAVTIETTITDSDTKAPTSGAVVDYTKKYGVSVYNNADQTFSDTTEVKINFGGEFADPDSVWDTANSKYVAPVSGLYCINVMLFVNMTWVANANSAHIAIKINSSTIATSYNTPANTGGIGITFHANAVIQLAANDEVYIYFTNNQAASKTVSNGQSKLGIFRVI